MTTTAVVNRSMPPGVIIPELAYADVGEAVAWLCRAFGFVERLRIGDHRCQLVFAGGAIVVIARPRTDGAAATAGGGDHAIMVRVANVDAHHERARRVGARIVSAPADYPYGERQYTVDDPGGHRWTFSESIADVDPQTWGGTLARKS
jgi:uncharacterized glyoxalase superfamily protein PhnB